MDELIRPLTPLRNALLMLVACGALAAALLLASRGYERQREDVYRAQMRQLESLQQAHAEAVEAWNIFSKHLAQYEALQKRGFIGAEARLEWVEALRLAARDVTPFTVDYQIDKQTEAIDLGAGQTRFSVYRSDMRVRLPLLHEGRLTALLDALEKRGYGVVELRGCSLTPAFNDQPAVDAINVQAECTLSWYTLGRPGAEDEET